MKIFTATVEGYNTCYVETLIIIANTTKEAHILLCDHLKREVVYTRSLKEITIDTTIANVIGYIGFGHNDKSNRHSND